MMLDIHELLTDMLGAAESAIKTDFVKFAPEIKEGIKQTLRNIAERLVQIEKLKLSHDITEREAKQLIEMQKENAKIELLTLEGLSEILIQDALSAAFKIISGVVNKALGWALL